MLNVICKNYYIYLGICPECVMLELFSIIPRSNIYTF